MLPQLVIFDMAGTTVTDLHEVEQCFAQAAAETGLRATSERILAVQGMAKRHVFDLLWREQLGTDGADVDARVDESYTMFKTILEHHYETQPVTPTEGCLAAFAWLSDRGIPIALTTGFYRTVTNLILNRLDWHVDPSGYYIADDQTVVQASIASDEVPNGRPAPDMICLAMQQLGITDLNQVVNIGDTPSDLLSGKAAGVGLNLGLTNGTHTEAQLRDYPHDLLLGSLLELPQLLSSRG
ncbi:HAD hydrolase-like protein [Fibrella sp. HMF5335]|uniref:HAD hydrolase-like protein n=1 Tax=Fibrella rubiginis TaxID=2817060 RepID=A0A939K536_9BACT|nr:HAD family hydrolase [Fibrella rubiginis]MBO0936040.1 HAD hydrolase-like protein [Fibrella rubiginis]